jgi:hypothetical protein
LYKKKKNINRQKKKKFHFGRHTKKKKKNERIFFHLIRKKKKIPTMQRSTATRRTQVIIGHILPGKHSNALSLQTTSASVDLVQPTVLPEQIKTQNHDFSALQDDFTFRPYVSGKDDAAFKALDYICYQGEKNQINLRILVETPLGSSSTSRQLPRG